MRRLLLPFSSLLLLAATHFLWQYRFERDPDYPTVRLTDLKRTATLVPGALWTGTKENPELQLQVSNPSQTIIQTIFLPNLPAVANLHLRLQMQSTGVQLASHPQHGGRLVLEWHTPDGFWKFDPIHAVRNKENSGIIELVLRPETGVAIPALRLQSQGTSEDFRLTLFEASAVRERPSWKIGSGVLCLAWAAWFAFAAGYTPKRNPLRPFLCAGMWLTLVVIFIFPGPWKTLHPLSSAFQIGPPIETAALVEAQTTGPLPSPSPATTPPGQSTKITPTPPAPIRAVPNQGNPILHLKNPTNQANPILRTLLHILLLLTPVLASAFLVGQRRALALGILISLAIETSQFLFGFGFDWRDLLDLTYDASGIFLALWIYRKLRNAPPFNRLSIKPF